MGGFYLLKVFNAVQIERDWETKASLDMYYPLHSGVWTDEICWKHLMYQQGYTHVLVKDGLFEMCKWGLGDKVDISDYDDPRF